MNWRPAADWQALALRARLLACARDFFRQRDVTEVQTPALQRHAATDPHLASVPVQLAASHREPAFLHTSPEFAMKRLLAAGSPDIYQVGPVFRDGEVGRHHQPEFTMIEWYRRGFGLAQMQSETCELIATLAAAVGKTLASPVTLGYQQLFRSAVGIDPFTATTEQLRNQAELLLGSATIGALGDRLGQSRPAWLDLLQSHAVSTQLAGNELVVVHGFPACQAALARLDPADARAALRFEVFYRGVELANGYDELTDVVEFRRRAQRDCEQRRHLGLPEVTMDPRLEAALAHGLPRCCGVALGFDRTLMCLLGASSIEEVMSFPAAG